MFDFVHEKRKLLQIVLLLIMLPFVFFGVDSYRHATDQNAPATVNGVNITQQEFDTAMRQQQDKMRQAMGANFDPAIMDKPEVKKLVLDNLVNQLLLLERAKSSGLTVTDVQIAQVINGIEAFRTDGKFDKKQYVNVLSSQNMSPLIFESRVREELTGQQMREAYTQNGYAANVATRHLVEINEQQRTVSATQISLKSYLSGVNAEPAEIRAYYEQNQSEFKIPEQIKVEYVTLSTGNLMKRVDVAPADARKYYDDHLSEFATVEERHAAHILLTVAATAPQAEQDAVKAKAESILTQVNAHPDQFANLAKQYSQDTGSAANGGDLGFFARGMMVKAFDATVFSLKEGEISGLVKSEFGYHIIKLIAIKPSNSTPYDQVSGKILDKLREQKAADQLAVLADKFSNAVYEQSDTLKPAAAIAGVSIEQSSWLSKGMAVTEIWTNKMLQAVFSDEVTKNHRNSAVVEVAPGTLIAARMLAYKPAAVRSLAEATDVIKQKIINKKALDMAVKQGKMLLGQLQQGKAVALVWMPSQTVSHTQRGSFDAEMIRLIFQSDSTKLPQYAGAEVPDGGFMIVRVDSIKNADKPDDAKLTRYMQQFRKMTGDELFSAYISDAKKSASIRTKLSVEDTEVKH